MLNFKVGDKVRCITNVERYSSEFKLGDEFIVIDIDNSSDGTPIYRAPSRRGIYEVDLQLVTSDPFNKLKGGITKMTKKLIQVIVVNADTGAIVKDKTVSAKDTTEAILKAFDVKGDNLVVKTIEVMSYEETPKPVEVVMTKKD